MKLHFIIVSFFLSFSLFGKSLKPCQTVGFEQIEEYAIQQGASFDATGLTLNEKNNKIKLLKECINNYDLCIVETNPQSVNWLNEKLAEPTSQNFDPLKQHIMFGLIQYYDKKRKVSVCTVAKNGFFKAIPWLGKSWTIGNGNHVTGYELYGDRFTTVMTPKSLYKALLLSYEDEIKSAAYEKNE